MKNTLRNPLKITTTLLASIIATTTFASTPIIHCPNLTINDVQSILDNGTIATEQGYTLADEAGVSRAQVIINEPTANPFDTYYQWMGKNNINNHHYWIYIGNVLGKTAYEAKDRAKQILLSDGKTFSGTYNFERKMCIYKEINASPSIPNYPFKSSYETISLIVGFYGETPDLLPQIKQHK